MSEFTPGGHDPLRKLFEVDLATDDDIAVAVNLATDILSKSAYEVARFYSYDTKDGHMLTFSTVDSIENEVPYSTVQINVFEDEKEDCPVISLEYDESGTIVDQAASGERSLVDNAAFAESIVNEILEQDWMHFADGEQAIFNRLLMEVQARQGKVQPIEYLAALASVHMSDAIKAVVAHKGSLPLKTTEVKDKLTDGTELYLVGCQYLDLDKNEYVASSHDLKWQIEATLPHSRTIDSLLVYYDGTVKYEAYVNNEVIDVVDAAYEQAYDQALEAGLFRPSDDAIKKITSALIDYSLQENPLPEDM